MDPAGNGGKFIFPIEGVLDAVNATPPIRGGGVPLQHNEGLPIFEVDGHYSCPLDESSTVLASRLQPLLSQLAQVARSSNSQGGSSYGHNLPRDILVACCKSNETTKAKRYTEKSLSLVLTSSQNQ
jgi:hypothetical protein